MSVLNVYVVACDQCGKRARFDAETAKEAEAKARLGVPVTNMNREVIGHSDRFTKSRTGEWKCHKCAGKPSVVYIPNAKHTTLDDLIETKKAPPAPKAPLTEAEKAARDALPF